ncbi:hypothetical protein [Nocardioides sp. URHA0020]|uniref:hypothetical protein n=1 Tax=Nocardioides sp. URHA0020 TaxID=1380392 RepID=UPI0006840B02|nr:hypothetical protein [Nocardioides sp. URHA0020]
MIDEREVAQLLRAATDDIGVPAAPARELAAAGGRRRRRRWVATSLATATAVAAVAVAVPVVLTSERPDRTDPPVGSPTTAPGASCVDPVPTRVLPSWARTGFSDPRPRMPYVLGDDGHIAAILFAAPLTSPPSPGQGNKILWVSRVDQASSLRISATLGDGTASATRVVQGGPGPSIIDLPEPGCWHLTLRWGDSSDTLDLAYVAP